MRAVVGRIAEANTGLLLPPVRTAEVLVIAGQVALEVARELANETEIRWVPNGATRHERLQCGGSQPTSAR
jgi:hypothetical protein